MPRIEVNGVHLNVEVTESREGKESSLVLLLHGFTGSARSWGELVPALSHRYETAALELLGHGFSDAPQSPERYSLECAVKDIAFLLDVLGHERSAVIGYSMGGRLALQLAVSMPERVTALVLESASPGLVDDGERQVRVESDNALADFIERHGVPAFVERWERHPLFATQRTLPDSSRDALRRQRLDNRAVGLTTSLRGMGAGVQTPLWDRLGDVTAPTLVVVGALDEKFRQIGEKMSRVIPGARFHSVPGAGHAVHLERPDEFAVAVTKWLEHVISRDRNESMYDHHLVRRCGPKCPPECVFEVIRKLRP